VKLRMNVGAFQIEEFEVRAAQLDFVLADIADQAAFRKG
jgi:hypothetical protein